MPLQDLSTAREWHRRAFLVKKVLSLQTQSPIEAEAGRHRNYMPLQDLSTAREWHRRAFLEKEVLSLQTQSTIDQLVQELRQKLAEASRFFGKNFFSEVLIPNSYVDYIGIT